MGSVVCWGRGDNGQIAIPDGLGPVKALALGNAGSTENSGPGSVRSSSNGIAASSSIASSRSMPVVRPQARISSRSASSSTSYSGFTNRSTAMIVSTGRTSLKYSLRTSMAAFQLEMSVRMTRVRTTS